MEGFNSHLLVYDDYECTHNEQFVNKAGDLVCCECGAIYNESTLTWEEPEY